MSSSARDGLLLPVGAPSATAQAAPHGAPHAKRCSLCGSRFGCRQGKPGCWCESVELGHRTLLELRTLAEDCLCPRCLEGFVRRDRGARDVDERAGSPPTPGRSESGVDLPRAGRRTWAKAIPHETVRARGIPPAWGISMLIFALLSLLVGLAIGPIGIGPGAIISSAGSHLPLLHISGRLGAVEEAILWQVRAPRVVLAALVGGMLAIAGSAYQGVFRNPLADPYLLGVAAGAGLGATLAIAYASVGDAGELLPLAAFAGAIAAVAATYALARSAADVRSAALLILAGVAVAAFLTAAQTFVAQQHTQMLSAIYSWLLGGFDSASWQEVALIAPYVALSSAMILAHRRVLDVLSLGDEQAGALGLDVRRVRLTIVAAATAGTAAAVAVSGLIGFVGIIVPHTIRLLVSSSYRAIVPLSLLAGAGFLVMADVIARSVLSPAEVPIGVVTAVFGAPFFAVVLRRARSSGW